MNTSVHQIKYSYLFFVLFFLHFDVFSRDNKNWEDQMYEDLLQIYQNNSDPYAITGEYFFKQEHDKTKVFTEGTKNKVNEILIKMDSLKRKTIIYVACGYMVRKTNNLQDKMTSQETQALVDQKSGRIDTVFARLKKKGIEISNINLHISLIVLIKNPNNKNDKKWDFEVNIDRFIPRSDMDNNCAKGVETEIGNANNEKKVGKVMSLSPNLAVIWRANLLVEKMKSCGTVPVHTGDGNKDILAILAHIKDKAAKKQNLIIHATEDHKPVISEINGTNLTIGKTKYERIRYKSFAKVDPSFSDPLVFKLEINNNADPKYAAFIFTKKDSSDKMLFTITIFDSKNEEKKDSLKKYLFGDLDFILNDVKWISQFDNIYSSETCWDDRCCNRACNDILDNSQVATSRANQVILMTGSVDCNTLSKGNNFKLALSILEKSIKEHQKPMLIGVNHPKCSYNKATKKYETVSSCSGNTPSITNHYVVAIGIGYDEKVKKKYIRFYEVGTKYADKGKSDDNRLYINEDEVSGNTAYNNSVNNCGVQYKYILTEVRKNDGYQY